MTLRWWQFALLKLSMAAFGVILGVYLHNFFLRYIAIVSVLFALPAVYLIGVWARGGVQTHQSTVNAQQ